jgi:RNA polymerase sigma-70 factor (ECF subfamily)
VLPIDYSPAAERDELPGRPATETVWLEPYPDEILEIEDGYASPDASYEQRESMELAFIAALQHLPANQRAALILREVLGFSAKEVAAALDTSVASVNSALQRARETVDGKLPEQSQQANLAALGDENLAQIVETYMDAMSSGDVDRVLSLLAEDAVWTMPPLATWYSGRDGIAGFLPNGPLSGLHRWNHLPARANRQPAVASYTWDEDEGAYLAFALDVFSLDPQGKIAQIDSFIVRSIDVPDDYDFQRYPDQPPNPQSLEGTFERHGLPQRLD